MIATLYIHAPSGFAADLVSISSATHGVMGKRGDNLALYVIYHDGTNIIELPADAAGSFMVKEQKGYAQGAIMTVASWTKQPGAGDGYLFALGITGTALDQLMSSADSLELVAEISWTTGGIRTSTPLIPFTVLNNLTR